MSNLRMEQAQSYWISNTVKPDLRTDCCVAWSLYPPTSWWLQTWLPASWAHGRVASVASVTEPFPRKQTTPTPRAKPESTPPTPNLAVPLFTCQAPIQWHQLESLGFSLRPSRELARSPLSRLMFLFQDSTSFLFPLVQGSDCPQLFLGSWLCDPCNPIGPHAWFNAVLKFLITSGQAPLMFTLLWAHKWWSWSWVQLCMYIKTVLTLTQTRRGFLGRGSGY